MTEPFTEWVLQWGVPGRAAALGECRHRFVEDIAPWENRKLWLLNGAHCVLSTTAGSRGSQ